MRPSISLPDAHSGLRPGILPRTGLGRAALLLAALLLGAQALDFGHRLAQAHEICAEHGELVHVDTSSLQADAARCGDGASQPAAAPREDSAASHEHCGLAALGQPSLPTPIPAAAVSLPLEASRELPPVASERTSGIPLFLLAPKQSPPA